MDALKEHVEARLIFLVTLLGVSLIPLLPVGIYFSLGGIFFKLIFFVHLGILVYTVALALKTLSSTASRALQGSTLDFRLFVVIATSALAFVIIALILPPITARDALIHHLAVPKWWVEHGSIYEIRWHEWSYYPMLINLGYTGLLALGLEHLTPWYHLCFLILLSSISAAFAFSRTGSARVSVLTALLVASIPICIRLGTTPLVDLGLALYSAVAIISAVRWLESPQENCWNIYCGVALGLALSCKLNGLLFSALLVPSIFIAGSVASVPRRQRLYALFLIGTTALLIYSPWLIKNYLWTGNPLFPLFRGVFGPLALDWGAPAGLNPIQQRLVQYGESWWELLLLPIRILIVGEDDNPRLFDGRLTPVLLLALLQFIRMRKQAWVVLFYSVCLSYLVFALVMSGARVRYLAPIYAPMAMLGVAALPQLVSAARLRILSILLIALHGVIFVSYSFDTMTKNKSIEYLFGKISRDNYLRALIPEYDMSQYMNQNLDKHSLTYLLGTGNRFYLYDKAVQSGGHHSESTIVRLLHIRHDALAVAESLKSEGYTHLMADYVRAESLIDSARLSDEEKATWEQFKHEFLEGIYHVRGFALWKIK